MDELKSKAAPKANELIRVTKEQNELLDVQIVLLDRLCTLKETQQKNDNLFRARWWRSKVLDTKLTFIGLFFLAVGFYTEFLHVDFSVFK